MLVDSRVSEEQSRKVWEIIEEAFEYSRKNEIPSDRSLLDFVNSRLYEEGYSKTDTRQMLQIAEVWGDVIGEPIKRQSLKFFWLEQSIDSGIERKKFLINCKTTKEIQATRFSQAPTNPSLTLSPNLS